MMNRRSFLFLGASPAASALAQTPSAPAPAAAASPFADPDFGLTAHLALGGAYYGLLNPGKLLAILARINPADSDSAWQAYHHAGAEARALAEQAAARRHNVSAREAYLWGASYYSAALRLVDGTKGPERASSCWQEYAACWSAAAALFDPPVERVEIPYQDTALTGLFFRADHSLRKKPLIILNNGADGLEKSMYIQGGAGALARGYNCLIFNGPGQGDSLWVRKLYFRPDWEKVITPVVDAMVRHSEVDPARIVLIGVSQGGFWAPRSLAFERRIAAGVADPGVWDVSEPWLRKVPQFLLDLVHEGKQSQFEQAIAAAPKDPRMEAAGRMRMRPYGTKSVFEVFGAVQQYKLQDVASRISCPMLVTDPEGEDFFPGQAQKLYDALRCPKKLIRFTHQQGAGQHCEAGAPGFRDHCIYNWLAETLAL
jgi:hypothetical protein